MRATVTALFNIDPGALCRDVYFRDDFVALHNTPHGIDGIRREGFVHVAGWRPIPGSALQDLWTPHGYGGPMATDETALRNGIAQWRTRQEKAGRVAEFIRFHLCFDPISFADLFDHVAINRPTVMVDLSQAQHHRHRNYSQSTRRFLRKAERELSVRQLSADDAGMFFNLHEAMLTRQGADPRHRLSMPYVAALLAMPWCVAWAAELKGRAVAASCFLITDSPVAHYHLGGGDQAGLDHSAQYLLFEAAFAHAAAAGCAWMHLGGGRTTAPDDHLLAFKRRFSPIEARFHVGGLIYDRAAYERLGGARGGLFLGYREPETPPPESKRQ